MTDTTHAPIGADAIAAILRQLGERIIDAARAVKEGA